MSTLLLSYLLIGFFIYWLGAAVFGVDPDTTNWSWQLVAIAIWPLVFMLATYRMATAQPLDEAAMQAALHRHEVQPNRRDGAGGGRNAQRTAAGRA